jgi:hypothetical protein
MVFVEGRYTWYLRARLVMIVYVATLDEFGVRYASAHHGCPGSWHLSSSRPCERTYFSAFGL